MTEEETIVSDDGDSSVGQDDLNEEAEIINEINDVQHEILYKEGHKHIEISDTAKSIVKEGEDANSIDSIDATNTEVLEVEEEEEIVLEDAEMVIGTTKIELIEEEDETNDNVDVDIIDADSTPIDEEILEDNTDNATEVEDDDGDNAEEEMTKTVLEYVEEEIPSDDVDPVVSGNENVVSDSIDAEIEKSDQDEQIDSNTSAEEQIIDDDSIEQGETSEIEGENEDEAKEIEEEKEEVTQIQDDDDEDDEDLAERVSVDYASKSAGALIIEKTAEFKGTSNLITGDRDRYAIVPCNEERKQVVMSLSEDILVKEIKLANYERFSSTVKDFQVKGSHTLGKWVDFGTFTARQGNGEQTFVLETPSWARYLKFKFLTHHGTEWFCTLSQIKVHGSNMVQDFHEHWENIEEENNEEQLDGDEMVAAAETSNADEIEHSSANTSANATANDKQPDTYLSNSSITHEQDAIGSIENVNPDGVEKGDAGPRHAQVTPSVHSKTRPLQQFRNHMTFSDIIQVEMGDEKLYSDLYNLVPHTLGNLPANAKNDLTCENDDHELKSVHQIGKLAMDSLYRFGSRIVDDFVASDTNTGKITSSKMDDFSNEFYQKRLGNEMYSLVHLYANNIVYPKSPSYIESPGATITDGNSSVENDESSLPSTQQSKETSEENKGEEGSSSQTKTKLFIEGTDDSLDFAIQKLLRELPSAECLVHLDFGEFKNKFDTARKSTGAAGGSQGGRMQEPIFKKLTDEIFALQTSLSVHDQFSKLSVGCYQRVILDLALETEKLRRDQDERLRRLEEQVLEPANMQMFQKLVVSLASTTTNWLISTGWSLFFLVKDIWIPAFLRYTLSKETFDGLKESYETGMDYSRIVANAIGVALDHSSRAVTAVATALESNGWVQEYLSAWSSYYDGGITVVFIVITLVVLRLVMMCSWILRPNKNRSSSPLRPSRSSRTSSSRTKAYPEDGLYTSQSKKQKKRSSKGKRRSKNPPNVPIVKSIGSTVAATIKETPDESIPELREETIKKCASRDPSNVPIVADIANTNADVAVIKETPDVPIVEDIATSNADVTATEEAPKESIPELQEERTIESPSSANNNNDIPSGERNNLPTTAHSPSVVSLEE